MARIHRRTIQKDLNDQENHDGVFDHSPRASHPGVQSQIALGSITTNRASGGDGVPAELFQILKDDAVEVLHSMCQQIWKT